MRKWLCGKGLAVTAVRAAAIALLLLLFLTSAARAQAPCSIQTITGTYAVQIGGGSFVGALVPAGASYQLHGGAAAIVAQLTVAADGSVRGSMWGVYVAQPFEAPYVAQVSVNPDCTGEWVDPDGLTFRFVVLGNGAEIRSIAWEGFNGGVQTWYRITRASDPAPRCGRHSLKGNYMMRCEGYELTGEDFAIASAWALFVFSASDGALKGKFYGERFGIPVSTQTEATFTGTYSVNDDCTVDKELLFDFLPGLSYRARGVLFDQGKQALGLPLGIYAGSQLVAPVLPLSCLMTRIGQ